ncbi:hypothetical protein ACH5RR_007760 [Cinchona calisaya]|uniref:Calmodulin-binding domain-containing protein n=1 Tax=Cinchona calisaya TaxID=153742 RepID=A0ABD3AFI3_9GENT
MDQVAIVVPMNLEKTTSKTSQLRRNLTSKLTNKPNEVNVWPNYLRASPGSCHDYCKYGFKHHFKTIAWTPMVKISKTSPRKSATLPTRKHLTRRRNSEINTLKGTSNSGLNRGVYTSKGIGNGTSNRTKKTYLLPTISSKTRKIDAKRVSKTKDVSLLKRNKNIASSLSVATRSRSLKINEKMEQPSDENIPEKILYITELNTMKNYEHLSPERIQSGMKSPRRLKFRQGEKHNRNVGCKLNAARNEMNEVVLRRQNPKKKRSTQSSYNYVIEETARKLAKTRKGKVNTLIGAFETVISLHQDPGAIRL